MILADQEKTSYSVVLAIPGIDRIFLHDPGANVNFSGSDLDFEAIKEADLFHFGYSHPDAKHVPEPGRRDGPDVQADKRGGNRHILRHGRH